jgi:hypothetical protein
MLSGSFTLLFDNLGILCQGNLFKYINQLNIMPALILIAKKIKELATTI